MPLVKFFTSLASRILSHECELQAMANICFKGMVPRDHDNMEVCLKSWGNAAKVLINSTSWTLAAKDSIDEIITSDFAISCMCFDILPQSKTLPWACYSQTQTMPNHTGVRRGSILQQTKQRSAFMNIDLQALQVNLYPNILHQLIPQLNAHELRRRFCAQHNGSQPRSNSSSVRTPSPLSSQARKIPQPKQMESSEQSIEIDEQLLHQ